MVTELANLMELSVAQSVETAPRSEKPQRAPWPLVARERGNVDTGCEEVGNVNCERFPQCIKNQKSKLAF